MLRTQDKLESQKTLWNVNTWGDSSSGGKKALPKNWGSTYCKDFKNCVVKCGG